MTTPDGGQDAVWRLDLQGNEIWRSELGGESRAKHRLGSSSNASPVTDGKGIFVYFRSSRLAALELDGTIRWSKDLAATYGPENLFWDQGTSPVVTEQHVILLACIREIRGSRDLIRPPANCDGNKSAITKCREKTTTDTPRRCFFKHKGSDAFLVWAPTI